MATKLTKKEKGFIKDYIKTGNGTQAALKNYNIKTKDKESTAAVIASENIRKPKIVKAIEEALPDTLLAERHLELLNKKETVKVRDLEGNETIQETNQIDVQAVSKGLDMAYKVKGSYAPDKSLNVNLNLDDGLTTEEKEKLRELINGNSTSVRKNDGGDSGGA